MQQQNIDAVIVPTNDPHFSEYVSDHFKCRQWLTGFTGSAGTAVVTQKSAALYTDSRYFLQAEQQLQNSGFELKKEGLPETESIADYIKKDTPNGNVGIDGKLYSASTFNGLKQELEPLTLKSIADPFAKIWTDRPPMPAAKAFLMGVELSGKSTTDKIKAFRSAMKPALKQGIYVVSALDEVAWLLNLRGDDVAFTPEALAFAIVSLDEKPTLLFIDKSKLSNDATAELKKHNVEIVDYNEFESKLEQVAQGAQAIVNPNKTAISVQKILEKNCTQLHLEANPFGTISSLKAVKNETEIAGFRQAMIADGVAWVRFWKWLEEHIDSGSVTEINGAEKLRLFRAQNSEFVEESFAPIFGYKGHGAIVHYSATHESNIALGRETFILIDTGAQYHSGTTDITRTLHLGTPTDEEKTDYTLVLKGHLQLSAAKFPHGTRGAQLDMLARQPLMQHHMTYLHGTGHGVGHFLSVHEGPQNIRLNENPTLLEVGMLTSCEPGVYKANKHGIRIENLVLTVPDVENEFGKFLQFEPITLCPIDTKAIDSKLLNQCDIDYLNNYHSKVYKILNPLLNEEEKRFLEEKTKAI